LGAGSASRRRHAQPRHTVPTPWHSRRRGAGRAGCRVPGPSRLSAARRRDEGERMKSLEIKPIGTVVGGRTEPTDDHWSGTAIIRLNPDFPAEVVQGLEEFSHLLVVWHFHMASSDDVALHARSPR